MSGIRVCATNQGRFFTSKNREHAPNFEVLLLNRPYFLRFYSRTGSFFDNLVSDSPAQMSKIPVAFSFYQLFCFVLFCFVLFCFVLFCSIILEQSVSSFLQLGSV